MKSSNDISQRVPEPHSNSAAKLLMNPHLKFPTVLYFHFTFKANLPFGCNMIAFLLKNPSVDYYFNDVIRKQIKEVLVSAELLIPPLFVKYTF